LVARADSTPKALKPVWEQVVIATKFGFNIDPETKNQAGLDTRPEHIRAVCGASLKMCVVVSLAASASSLYQHRIELADRGLGLRPSIS
jgi:hypothetical protein